MGDKEESAGGEQDDVSFLRTGDIVCLTCLVSNNQRDGAGAESERGVSDNDFPPDIASCMLYIDNALSVRALQEMMSADSGEIKGSGGTGGHKTLLYGHAVQLKHVQSEMFLACLSSCSSNDKLAFDVGVQESNAGESCWWTIHPASKQRSEGEKVRAGDDVILVSVATERYLHMTSLGGEQWAALPTAVYRSHFMVIASFHQTLWNVTSVSSGSVRIRNMGSLFGNDVVRLFHGNDECLTIPENWSEYPSHNMIIYEGGAAVSQARSLWRIELIRTKWHGALVGYEQPFRVRHITTGRYLGVVEGINEKLVQLLHKERATYANSAFVLAQNKDPRKQMLDEKEEEGMGIAAIRYGETNAFIRHADREVWLTYQTLEVTKKGLGKVEEKKAIAHSEGHMDDCYTFFMALEEESMSARVIRKCSSVLNRFLKGIEGLQTEGEESVDWMRVDLQEVLKLMQDLIEYFAQPGDELDFESRQNRFRALRSRQDLFQAEGVLNMILDTIDKFSIMEAMPNFVGLIGEENQLMWEEISTYLYLLVAAMIKGNHSNCAQFAALLRLDWLFGRLSNPQSAEGILDVLYCVLTESPEALNMINEGHIRSVISLLEKVGRDPKVLDVLSSLCEGNGMAVRSSQNTITDYLLPGKDLLLQTKMRDYVASMMPNILVGVVDGSSLFKRWYFEAEVEHVEGSGAQRPYLRVGWANTVGFKPFPGPGDGWGCGGVGDDFYSYGFDGMNMFCAGKARQVGHRVLRKGDIVGCSLDLISSEIRFTFNGEPVYSLYKNFNTDGFFFPVMSLSAKVSCRFIFGRSHGRLKFGPPSSFSPIFEALNCPLTVQECLSFGDIAKTIFAGPSAVLHAIEPFVPLPVDTANIALPNFALEAHPRFAENLHELWAMRKVDLGWIYGEVRNEESKRHPCLTTFDRLPDTEKAYNINLALDTMRSIEALGWHLILDQPPTRLRPVRLPQNYAQPNGYKPQPLDTHEIELSESMQSLIEALARNTHNVWAKEKIKRGWTFGISELVDASQKRTPHLVPYDQVDERIKEANREAAAENIRSLQLFGIFLEAPVLEHDDVAEKEMKSLRALTRTFRAESTYKVTSGKWYYEVEVLTEGFMKIGWMDVSAPPETSLGLDEFSYGFDGHLSKKWHQGAEHYGREWKVGDVVGCFLDLNDRTISFSLNGELLLDPSGSEMAFDNVQPIEGYVPAMTLAAGQRDKFNFGQDSNSLKFFTTCGLQEGYEPFCVNMYRSMPFWYAKRLSRFEEIDERSKLDVQRLPATATMPPSLKLCQKTGSNDPSGGQEKARMEFIRLSLPVNCNRVFVKNKEKEELRARMEELQQRRNASMSSILKGKETDEERPRSRRPKPFLSSMRNPPEPIVSGAMPDDRRSQQTHKTSSFDSSHELLPNGATAALAKSSLLDMSVDERSSAAEKLRDMTSKEGKTKKSTGILGRIRERQQKNRDEGRRHQRTTEDFGELNTMKTLRSFDSTSVGGLSRTDGVLEGLEVPVMPSSGPGRQPTVKRRPSPLKKRFATTKKRQLLEPANSAYIARTQSVLAPMSSSTSAFMQQLEQQQKAETGAVAHRLSLGTGEEGGPVLDDVYAMQEMGEQVDEYYYGIRIFPGQDLSNVWVGWVTPQFHAYDKFFDANASVRKCRYAELDHHGITAESIEYRNCYMLNAVELLNAVADVSNTKVSGLQIGCLIDTSMGELSFHAQGQDSGMKFKLEPGAMLYPAVFFVPTSTEIFQFELGRVRFTFPLSAAMFKSSARSIVPYFPPRLTIEKLCPIHWARMPNESLRASALKLSETRGWSVLCDDPVRTLMVYVPERDESVDILELIEKPDLLVFHARTLNLYCKLASHGNQKVAHQLCAHIDESQLTYAVKSPFLSGPMRQGLVNFLIAVHLKSHADARLSTAKEYVIPLVNDLRDKNVFNTGAEDQYPQVLGPVVSILPVMKYEAVQSNFGTRPNNGANLADLRLLPPGLNFGRLREHVMGSLRMCVHNAVMSCRDFIGGNNLNHFEPILKLFDTLLVIGLIKDSDIIEVLRLVHPNSFTDTKSVKLHKGLADIDLAEGVKLQFVFILEHICDIQARHRIESLVSFCDGFVVELQQDQCKRYMDIKQTEMPPAEAAKRTKEFRCPPKEQMYRLLHCKLKEDHSRLLLDDETDEDQCPTSEHLQEHLREYCANFVAKVGRKKSAREGKARVEAAAGGQKEEEELSWVDKLAQLVVSVPPPPKKVIGRDLGRGTEKFRELIITTLKRWANETEIEAAELVRAIFNLLLRQYSGVKEMMDCMETTYVLHERNLDDVRQFVEYLMQIRELLNVQLETAEEAILKRGLWQLMNNRIFFQHPDLMRLLRVHEDVMCIMMNVLTAQQSATDAAEMSDLGVQPASNNASEMVVACSRFLCYFCRTSRMNQKAMFEHLSFLLDNATMLLARPSLRGSVPLDVAYSSFMDNNELALALKEEELDKVAVYLMRCGLQPNSEMIAKEYPDIGWDPVEGERYLDFLRFCVWINGENVEENANLVIRLLIRRPECLGVALKGEGQGLFAAFKEAILLSEDIRRLEEGEEAVLLHSAIFRENAKYPSKEVEGEDYVDLGAAILDFYSSLVDLLAKCAPDPMTIQAGHGDSVRARAILRSLISLDDLCQILSLRFTIPNLVANGSPTSSQDDTGPLPGLLPNHKHSVLLFLDRVYSIDSQEMFFAFLEQSFLPDLRAATMMDSPKALESDTALALNRYLCNAVLPLLTNHAQYFADAEHHAALLDATQHTVYRMNRLRSLTKNQRDAVSDFLVALTRELPPAMLIKLLRKVILDIQQMTENVLVPLRIMTLHYERCNKYYGGGNSYGVASETEKRLSMLLFYAIFDSLSSKPYDPELFGKALPCLTAIGSSISPDYALTSERAELAKVHESEGVWVPRPAGDSSTVLNNELKVMKQKFAEHFHDSWAARKMEKGWVHGQLYSRKELTHPRLVPFSRLQDYEREFYRERCAECIRALLAWGYQFELVDHDATERANQSRILSGHSEKDFNPRPVDLSSMNLEKGMLQVAERMAENSHAFWARKVFGDMADNNAQYSSMPLALVPWDLLTDFERRKDRFRAQEVLKFFQYHGYRLNSTAETDQTQAVERVKGEGGERSSVEKRFAYNLLEKLLAYLEQANVRMKSLKPSHELTRRNSFRREGRDVKFFEKVVLPLMFAYFNAHKQYFMASSSIVQTGTASNKEKEMVANLFCRLAALLRIKNHAFGSVAKITVRCLQGLTQALDVRTLVKTNSDIVRTGLLIFFNNCADDLFLAVNELKEGGQYSLLRGENLKSWVSMEFAFQMIIPVLTTMYLHLAKNHFGTELLLDDIQAACYKILDSLYMVSRLANTCAARLNIQLEVEKHRAALGQCLSAFSACFPVAFLEAEFNSNNKLSVLAKTSDQSVQVQEMLQNLSQHIPLLDKLLQDIEQCATKSVLYADQPTSFDVDLPLMCSYLAYWWQQGAEASSRSLLQITQVTAEHINRVFCSLLTMMKDHVGRENAPWLCRAHFSAVPLIQYVTCDPVRDHMLPVAEHLRKMAEKAFADEERMRTHPDEADDATIAEDNARLVRDVYAFFPIMMKFTDLHRAKWLKVPSWESDGIYENVAVIFRIWSLSQHFKREELNYMAQFEDGDGSLSSMGAEMKTGKAAIAERKKRRREGQVRRDKHANSIVIACLKRLLPVGLNVFGGRELDIVQQSKERFLAKENEEKVREFIRSRLTVPVRTDPTDKNAWQLSLYRKIGKSQMRGKEEMSQEGVVDKIANMAKVVAILHTVTSRLEKEDRWKKVLTLQRKRMAISLITASHLYRLEKHRGINYFLPVFSQNWLNDEDVDEDRLVPDICNDAVGDVVVEPPTAVAVAVRVVEDESGGLKIEDGPPTARQDRSVPDALRQLILCFQRAATSEESGQAISTNDDKLFIRYADVMCRSVHIGQDTDEGTALDDDNEVDQAEKEEMAQTLRAEQGVLANRGAAIMVLMYLSAANGEPSKMVAQTLQLGIHLLSGGNKNIQKTMLNYLQLKKDVRFFTSLSGLMNKCSVLNLEMFERQIKAEGLGMGAALAAGEHQNLNDAPFTCSLFRFMQLTCEGHNLDFQNYLRTQPGHTTSVNLINSTVDYLLRLQESVMDFYWHYSSKEVIDENGKEYFLRAIQVCSQVFNTLTESIQGPCVGNQMTLANSRLWDAINGFFFLFAHMMEKLYKNSTQLELLREFLNLQKDMVVLMLSMLEGNVLNGPIGKQMVDALVESQQCVEMILKFSDMFLKLKDLTTSQAFQDFDTNRDGWISPKEFQRAMEAQKMYSVEEITYLMMCTDVNNDGKIDYMEFTERFHNPARDIGFNLAVLLTNLKEHITNDPRLEKIVEKASSLLDYFDPFLGRIEIMGSSKKVEKIYFEIQESWLEQWCKQQIRDSKNAFLFNVLQDDGGDQGKLEAFINFCEDTIFEVNGGGGPSVSVKLCEFWHLIKFDYLAAFSMQHAAEISSGDSTSDSKTYAGEQISKTLRAGYKCGLNAAAALRPENVQKELRRAAKKFRSMSWTELFTEMVLLSFRAGRAVAFSIIFLLATACRFVGNLMEDSSGGETEADQHASGAAQRGVGGKFGTTAAQTPFFRDYSRTTAAHDMDAFGIHIHHHAGSRSPSPHVTAPTAEGRSTPAEGESAPHGEYSTGQQNGTSRANGTEMPLDGSRRDSQQSGGTSQRPSVQQDDAFLKSAQDAGVHRPSMAFDATPMPRPSIYDVQSMFGGSGSISYYGDGHAQQQVGLYYEPKIAEQFSSRRSRGSVMNVLARNFKSIEKITLYLAFFINVILLFHRVEIGHQTGGGLESNNNNQQQQGDEEGEADIVETIYITGMTVPYISYEITGWILGQALYWLSVFHAIASIALLISFYQLKIPLITFKREKEVARKLMFDGCWITEDEAGSEDRGLTDTLFWYLDRIVISSKSFPMKYWDKFVRRKTKQKYREQVDEETLNALLGTERSPGDTSFDYRYTCWLWTGVILTNRQFLYRVCYLLCSASGVLFSPFFYAFLLIDVVLSFPMLKAILQSVTHNLQQLILTIMMTLVVVYLYTVVAFNFFRKFYVQEEEGADPDRKCHYMLTCFIYHFYAGVRAGGGIGDELESPYGDELEYARMLYDISFFFFVIVILLAIMQGLIIDAFGELRDQQESATEKLESSCFICDIGKDTFDRMPRGFEIHTTKEHNFANYLFFLQHLVNKDETEYTGQETFVREKYDNRDWEFFPVGECFMKQYENELLQL
uniref:Ryanodine receptor n=1 Tax=Globodera rostochiensis TaxID=31243 RepID=A0A914H250_GLORO